MKLKKILAWLLTALTSLEAYAQLGDFEIGPRSLGESDEVFYSHELGFFTRDIQNLVDAVDIVFLGRYGSRVGSHLFFGYDHTREDVERMLDEDDQWMVDELGLTVADYEIVVDEILKDNGFIEGNIVLRIPEDEEDYLKREKVSYRQGQHLFFLSMNPDGTYGLDGKMFDMKDADTSYVFYIRGGDYGTALGSEDKDKFMLNVLEAINKAAQ